MARWQVVVLVVLAVLLVAAGVYLFGPWGDADLSSRPNPAKDYAEAAARIVRVQEADRDPRIADRGHSIALLHGSQTETAVVIFHGFTDSPRRVRLLAKAYYDAGANVWVPRAPYHGYEDRMTSDQSLITATKLREYADAAVDVGAGLGRRVVVAGPSGGGALSLWALAERPEVSAAVAVSPFLHPKTGLPVWEMKPLARYLAIGPDFYHWWDPVLKGLARAHRQGPERLPARLRPSDERVSRVRPLAVGLVPSRQVADRIAHSCGQRARPFDRRHVQRGPGPAAHSEGPVAGLHDPGQRRARTRPTGSGG